MKRDLSTSWRPATILVAVSTSSRKAETPYGLIDFDFLDTSSASQASDVSSFLRQTSHCSPDLSQIDWAALTASGAGPPKPSRSSSTHWASQHAPRYQNDGADRCDCEHGVAGGGFRDEASAGLCHHEADRQAGEKGKTGDGLISSEVASGVQ
jgi:hypothetical protein